MKRALHARRSVRLSVRTLEDRLAPAVFGPVDTTVPVGTQPQSVAAADLNGDGCQDLAVVNFNGNSLSVLLGDGGGGFSPAAGSPIAVTYPKAVLAGDFNGDGRPDLAVAHGSGVGGTVTVLLGTGGGGFGPAPGSPVPAGPWPESVARGDLNGDGYQDLAVANNTNGGTVTVLLGTGTGSFGPAAGSPVAVGNGPRSVAVGDFNGDGKPDLAASNHGGNDISILLGTGSGTFALDAGSPVPVGTNPGLVALGDFNGDGSLDIAVPNGAGNSVTVLLGTGSGGFGPAPGSPIAVGSGPSSVAVGEFDGDGHLDLVVSNFGSNEASVLLGIGDGGLVPAPGSPVATGANPYFVAVGEFDGDGLPDLAVANYVGNTVGVYLNQRLAGTVTSLAASAGPTTYGQVVSFTASVTTDPSSPETPTGIVSFFDGSTLLGTGSLSGGLASFSTAFLGSGTHQITAAFNANSLFAGGPASAPVTHQVDPASTTVTLAGPGGPTASGQNAAFTATVAVTAPGSGSPTGTVTFFDGPTPIGTVAVGGGVAVLNMATLAPGSHAVTAVYNGSANHTGSQGSILVTHLVTGVPTLGGVPGFVQMDEQSPLAFTATAAAGAEPVFSLIGAPVGASIDPATGKFNWTPTEAQGPDVFVFEVQVTDGLEVTAQPVMVVVREVNQAPALADVPPFAFAVRGHPLQFAATVADPDLVGGRPNALTYSLVGGPPGAVIDPDTGEFAWTPDLAQPDGEYTFRMRVADDGVPALAATQAILVNLRAAAVVGGDLAVAGTPGPDVIVVRPGIDLGLSVVVNGRGYWAGMFGLNGRIVVRGFDGNDRITVRAGVPVGADLIGGAGNDVLTGGVEADRLYGGLGSDRLAGGDGGDLLAGETGNDVLAGGLGNDVLLGGDGNDALAGGPGANVLVGGNGADRLAGGPGDDLLVGGFTTFEWDPTGLANVVAEWASGRPYQERIDHLTGTAGGANAGTFLTPTVSVFNDGFRDVLTGGRGADWFVVSSGDKIDRKADERVLTV